MEYVEEPRITVVQEVRVDTIHESVEDFRHGLVCDSMGDRMRAVVSRMEHVRSMECVVHLLLVFHRVLHVFRVHSHPIMHERVVAHRHGSVSEVTEDRMHRVAIRIQRAVSQMLDLLVQKLFLIFQVITLIVL